MSHCREDAGELVLPVYDRLLLRGVSPWLDHHDYPLGPTSVQALQDGILKSRHVVFFITPSMLNVARGWCVVEYTLSRILQNNLQRSLEMSHVVLPLFFVDRNDPLLARSVWRDLVERGGFFAPGATSSNTVEWAADQIIKFLVNEHKHTEFISQLLRQVPSYARMMEEPGLIERVTNVQPEPLFFLGTDPDSNAATNT